MQLALSYLLLEMDLLAFDRLKVVMIKLGNTPGVAYNLANGKTTSSS